MHPTPDAEAFIYFQSLGEAGDAWRYRLRENRSTTMAPFFILLVSFLILRGVGWLGVHRLSSWRGACRYALAVMFLFTGATHFSGMRDDYLAMIPDPLPQSLWLIYLTGIFEIAGALGLLSPRSQKLAGICLAILLIAVFPANVHAAMNDIPFGGRPPTPLQVRAPIQLLFVGAIWWSAIGEPSIERRKEVNA